MEKESERNRRVDRLIRQKNWWFKHSEAVGLSFGFSDNIDLINEINSYYIFLVSPAFLMVSTAFSDISR